MERRFGNYEVERALGAGSFATVWLARDPLLETHVAVKVLADNWARNPDVRRRFVEEAKILRQISHDDVVRVFQIDETSDDRPYFAMEWADRGSLFDRLTGRPGDIDDAVTITIELLDCLTVVHDFGVVHRDIKPSNVLYRSLRTHERAADRRSGRADRIDRAVLGDFGLAKNLVEASGFTMAAGTPAYMAPEQAKTTSTTGPTADVYSTGAVLFELLIGRPPFDTNTLSDIRAGARQSGAPSVASLRPDIPGALAALVERALDPDPGERFESAFSMAEALRTVASADTSVAGPVDAVGAGDVQPSAGTGDVRDVEALARDRLLSGSVCLTPSLSDDAMRILSAGTAADRLGEDARLDRAALHDAAEAALARWTAAVNTGRIPFSARSIADAVIDVLERLWQDTQP